MFSSIWSSTKYMIDSLIHQKQSLHAYSSEENNTLPAILTANQWGLLEKTSKVLTPFEELTTNVSAASSTAADVIPSIHVLIRFLSKESEDDQGIQTMKTTLLDAVRRRFKHIESEPLYTVATLLDPRYKDKYFTNAENLGNAKTALKAAVLKTEGQLKTTTPPADETVSEPMKKTPRTEGASSSLGSIFDEILEESSTAAGPSEQITPGAIIEMESYLCETPIERKNNPLHYWRVNQARFPTLAATSSSVLLAQVSRARGSLAQHLLSLRSTGAS
ncbi:zinc finger BED domain-containing protein 4 [Austrofundulus limnaeus]|uniref:Zinc finger BED domain-containing protein 4 n=1 Tax=Austrofundulus limnaeus TaxID=52670 RepID=A0A2I4CJB2_AUSLI|nr:PREDICTED: zinc finger BED domain-containing protein 4-like [Austrofundulus limnaeus]